MTSETMIQPKVTGYRQLTQEEAALMNEIKALGPQVQAVCAKINAHLEQQMANGDEAERKRILAANPGMWLNWGECGIQSNLMYLTRAIAQPSAF